MRKIAYSLVKFLLYESRGGSRVDEKGGGGSEGEARTCERQLLHPCFLTYVPQGLISFLIRFRKHTFTVTNTDTSSIYVQL